jgi:hypothetical protein
LKEIGNVSVIGNVSGRGIGNENSVIETGNSFSIMQFTGMYECEMMLGKDEYS